MIRTLLATTALAALLSSGAIAQDAAAPADPAAPATTEAPADPAAQPADPNAQPADPNAAAPAAGEAGAVTTTDPVGGEELDATAYYKRLYSKMDLLKIDRKFTSRAVNDGFSGGEKKRCEILQMAMLEPAFALMDETDSGLDIDALRIVAEGVNALRGEKLGIMMITHYQRLLDYIIPDFVHVMWDGRIVKSGDKSLALELEAKGYDWIKKELVSA